MKAEDIKQKIKDLTDEELSTIEKLFTLFSARDLRCLVVVVGAENNNALAARIISSLTQEEKGNVYLHLMLHG